MRGVCGVYVSYRRGAGVTSGHHREDNTTYHVSPHAILDTEADIARIKDNLIFHVQASQ